MNPTNITKLLFMVMSILALQCQREQPEITSQDLRNYVSDFSSSSMFGRESGSRNSRRAAFYIANRLQQVGLKPAFTDELNYWHQLPISNSEPSILVASTSLKNNASIKPETNKKNTALDKNYYDPKIDLVLQKSPIAAYIQPFTFKAGVKAGPRNIVNLSKGKKYDAFISKVTPYPASKPGNVSSEMVFGGFCLYSPKENWNDFKNNSVKDKIVLCLRHGPGGAKNSKFRKQIGFSAKWQAAKKFGAVGIIFLGRDGYQLPTIHSFRPNMKSGPIAVFTSHIPFYKRFKFLKKEYENLLNGIQSKLLGQVLGQVRLKTDFSFIQHKGYNTGAWLRTPKKGQRTIIVGAHLDHLGKGFFSSMGSKGALHNGADDNASGASAVLELAIALKTQINSVPKNVNILFLHFDGEERGLIGSRYFVASKFFPLKSEAMINMDMVGRLRKTRGLSVQGCQTADSRWKELLTRTFAEHLGGGSLIDTHKKVSVHTKSKDCGELVGQNGMRMRLVQGGSGPSDHSPFYRKNMSIAFFFTGSHRQYHTQHDKAHLINTIGLRDITLMARDLILGWAQLKKPLVFKKAPAEASRSDFDFKLRLGIVPGSYEVGGEGLLVDDVKSSAPIAKSGIKAGDLITKIGKKNITDINDLMEFLSNAASGRSYVIEYKRNGKIFKTQSELMSK